MVRASAIVFPLSRSVSTELDAIAATQPCVLKRAASDPPGFDTNSEPQHIAADRICHFDRRRSIGKFARIVGIAKMVKHSVVEHQRQYKAECPTLKVRIGCRSARNVPFCTLRGLSFFSECD